MRLGIGLKDVSLAQVEQIAARAEAAGLDTMLFPETGHVSGIGLSGRDPFLCSLAALRATGRLRAGPAVAATTIRSARAMGLTAATVHEASDGRFLLGCGVSHRAHVEALGLPYPSSTVSHAATYLAELRRFSTETAGYGRGFPLYLAALGPRMVGLAAEQADGIMLNWLTVAGARDTVERYRDAGGGGESFLLVRVGPDDALRRDATAYRAGMPNYAEHFRAFGLESTEQTAADTCLPADAKAVVAGLRSYAQAGVTVPCLYPTGMDHDQIIELIDAIAGELDPHDASRNHHDA